MLPVYISNMVVVFLYFKYLKNRQGFLSTPLDFNYRFTKEGLTLIGPHKRFDGSLIVILVGIVVVAIQYMVVDIVNPVSIVDYHTIPVIMVGFLLGCGCLIGGLVKSFIKRRFKVAPHARLIILDQIDHVLGGIIFVYPVIQIPWQNILIILITSVPLMLGTNIISYKLKIKDVWW